MTKKDYIKIAQILRKYLKSLTQIEIVSDAPYNLIRDFEQMLKKDNPNFNEVKFQQYIYD